MKKIDFKKASKDLWQPPMGPFTLVEVPRMRFAMVDCLRQPVRRRP